jgi:hypothetical protein
MLRRMISRAFCRRSNNFKTASLKRQALIPAFERLEERLALSAVPVRDINNWPIPVPPSQLTKVESSYILNLVTFTTSVGGGRIRVT